MKPVYGYDGLRLKPNYDQYVHYLQYDQQILKYPDRWAKQIRESPYLTQLDGDGYIELQKQQENAQRYQERERQIQRVAQMLRSSTANVRATRHDIYTPRDFNTPRSNDSGEQQRDLEERVRQFNTPSTERFTTPITRSPSRQQAQPPVIAEQPDIDVVMHDIQQHEHRNQESRRARVVNLLRSVDLQPIQEGLMRIDPYVRRYLSNAQRSTTNALLNLPGVIRRQSDALFRTYPPNIPNLPQRRPYVYQQQQQYIPIIYPQADPIPQLQYAAPQQNTSPIHTASQPKAPLRAIEPPPKAGMPSSSSAGMPSSSSADAGAGMPSSSSADAGAGPSMGRQSVRHVIDKLDKKEALKQVKVAKIFMINDM